MCNFVKENQCSITKQICPYVYYCNKNQRWMPSKFMPTDCKIKISQDAPPGYYKVCYEKRGNLYISVNGYIEIYKNPYDFIPNFVKLKNKNGKKYIKDWK